uniref:NADH dehydrogenase subunit 6 n=1 Tax=Rhinebothrium megacanthophallus TaxID=595946 RepID=A0A8K1W6R4_9CEST|nr:NADH dehydrogenase subunit 6 [Rhinebothrium megacanthophallus]
MLLSLSFFLYFIILSLFSLISHPVYYCVLLVTNSLLCSFICYSVYGFSWYSLLFCLVYIGGVYILFVFVSVHSPNSSVVSFWNYSFITCFVVVFFCLVGGGFIMYCCLNSEYSSYLCTISEGPFYVCMCLTLLFGFIVLSIVMSVKVNHYR